MTNSKPNPPRERLTVEVPPDVKVSLTRWASEEGRPIGNLVRRVLTNVVAAREAQDGRAVA
jgi:hypothetical protein